MIMLQAQNDSQLIPQDTSSPDEGYIQAVPVYQISSHELNLQASTKGFQSKVLYVE